MKKHLKKIIKKNATWWASLYEQAISGNDDKQKAEFQPELEKE